LVDAHGPIRFRGTQVENHYCIPRKNADVSVKLHLRHKRKKRHVRSFVRLYICLSVCLSGVSVRGVHPMGGRGAMLRRNLRGRGINIRDQAINTRNLIG